MTSAKHEWALEPANQTTPSYFLFHLESVQKAFSLPTTLPLCYTLETLETTMATGQPALTIRPGTFIPGRAQESFKEPSFSHHPELGLIKSVGNTKPGGAANVLEDRVRIQSALNVMDRVRKKQAPNFSNLKIVFPFSTPSQILW